MNSKYAPIIFELVIIVLIAGLFSVVTYFMTRGSVSDQLDAQQEMIEELENDIKDLKRQVRALQPVGDIGGSGVDLGAIDEDPQTDTFSFDSVEEGDFVAGNVVEKIVRDDVSDQVAVTFAGDLTVAGTYVYRDDGVCFTSIEDARSFPVAADQAIGDVFCIEDGELIAFGEVGDSGTGEVVIGEYTLERIGITQKNTAQIVRIVDVQKN
jgi:hypothetical protein